MRVDAACGASRGVHRGPRFEPQCGAELITTLRRAGKAPRSSAARCIDRTRLRGSRHGVGGHPCSGGRAHRGGTSMRSTEHVSGSGGGAVAERRGRSAAQQLRVGCGAAGSGAVGPDGGGVPAEDRSPPRGGRAAGRLGKTTRAVWHPSDRPTKAFCHKRAMQWRVTRRMEGKRAVLARGASALGRARRRALSNAAMVVPARPLCGWCSRGLRTAVRSHARAYQQRSGGGTPLDAS